MPGVPPHELELQDNALAMIIRNLNFSEGLVNGQKVIIRSISPGARVIQVELPHDNQVVLIPRINFKPKVGKNGITFSRVQLPLRVAYSITISKSQGQTLSRIGLDLRSHPFGHGMLYVALSRAQSRGSVMCLVSPNHVMGNVAHVANVVYPAFIDAATRSVDNGMQSQTSNPPNSSHLSINNSNSRRNSASLPGHNNSTSSRKSMQPPPPPGSNPGNDVGNGTNSGNNGIQNPPVYQWAIVNETGDGACLLRSISRYLHGSPDHHHTLRNMLVQFVSANLDTVFPNTIMTFRHDIQNGIANNEQIVIQGQFPVAYNSVEQYLQLMSNPHAYMQPILKLPLRNTCLT